MTQKPRTPHSSLAHLSKLAQDKRAHDEAAKNPPTETTPQPGKMSTTKKTVIKTVLGVLTVLGGGAVIYTMGENKKDETQQKMSVPVENLAKVTTVPVKNPHDSIPERPSFTTQPATTGQPYQDILESISSPETRFQLERSLHAELIPGMRGENWVKMGEKHLASGKEPYWTYVPANDVTPKNWRPPHEITAAQAFREFPFDDVPEVALYRVLEASDPRLTLVIIRQVHKDGLLPIPARFAGIVPLRKIQSQIRRIVNWLSDNNVATSAQVEGCGESTMELNKKPTGVVYASNFQNRYDVLPEKDTKKLFADIQLNAGKLSSMLLSSNGLQDTDLQVSTSQLSFQLHKFSKAQNDPTIHETAGKIADEIYTWAAKQNDAHRLPNGLILPQPSNDCIRPSEQKVIISKLLGFAEVLEGWSIWRHELKVGPTNLDPVFGGTYAAFFDGKIALLQATTDAFEDTHSPQAGDAAVFDDRETNMLKFACHPGFQTYGTCRIMVMGASHDMLNRLATHNAQHPEFQISAIELTPTLQENQSWCHVLRDKQGNPIALQTITKYAPPDTGRVVRPKRKPKATVPVPNALPAIQPTPQK